MKTEIKTSKELRAEALQDLREQINSFLDEFSKKTESTDDFITMDDIETLFSKLDTETRKIYLTMLSGRLDSIDEKALIKSKKENSPKRG